MDAKAENCGVIAGYQSGLKKDIIDIVDIFLDFLLENWEKNRKGSRTLPADLFKVLTVICATCSLPNSFDIMLFTNDLDIVNYADQNTPCISLKSNDYETNSSFHVK